MSADRQRLIVVSNRLPIIVSRDSEGRIHVERGSGGLVTALCPALRKRSGAWFGWAGGESDPELQQYIHSYRDECAHELQAVQLTAAETDLYYNGFANEILWPLFHDFIWLCNFDPDYWPAYQSVNMKFADSVAEHLQADDFIWVHDYHLTLVAAGLRQKGIRHRVGFFLHIPFPSIDGYMKLPWRVDLLDGLLQYDAIGFQTERDTQNFIRCVKTLVPSSRMRKSGKHIRIQFLNRDILVGTFPISIDYNGFVRRSRESDVKRQADHIREHIGEQQLVLGLDRLDYTKGIPRRLAAFAEALTAYPELRRRITFLQVIVPSRTDVARYQTLKEEIERLVGEINGRFTQPGWIPVQYMYRHLCETELLAYYRCADIALITPLKDGMNLVAKEYVTCNHDGNGVLILSEFAGAARQMLNGALIVNPFDKKMVAAAIHHAFNMDLNERLRQMDILRQSVHSNDVFKWVDSFLAALTSPDSHRKH